VERTFDGKTFENLPQMPEVKYGHCLQIVDDERIIATGYAEKSEWNIMSFNLCFSVKESITNQYGNCQLKLFCHAESVNECKFKKSSHRGRVCG
jgi:deoxycytidylate deaminase